jgi:heat shock protein HtpX
MAPAHHRRSELFPPDRGLQARMLMAMLATPLSIAVAFVLVAWLLPPRFLWALIGAAVIGVAFLARELRRAVRVGVMIEPPPEVPAIVDRLCLAADLPRPLVSLDPDRQPNSWVVDLPRRHPHLWLTRGLVALLEPAELEAVIAHELAHIAHRDATVMSIVGLPADVLEHGTGHGMGGFFGLASLVPLIVGMVGQLGTASLSRHRELTADAGAAALTGRPSALASALLKVSGALEKVPARDLREAAGFPTLNLLPLGDEPRRPWRTHPSVEERVARLEGMERRLAGARAGAPRD